jgi:hypothetical protein
VSYITLALQHAKVCFMILPQIQIHNVLYVVALEVDNRDIFLELLPLLKRAKG